MKHVLVTYTTFDCDYTPDQLKFVKRDIDLVVRKHLAGLYEVGAINSPSTESSISQFREDGHLDVVVAS